MEPGSPAFDLYSRNPERLCHPSLVPFIDFNSDTAAGPGDDEPPSLASILPSSVPLREPLGWFTRDRYLCQMCNVLKDAPAVFGEFNSDRLNIVNHTIYNQISNFYRYSTAEIENIGFFSIIHC